MYTIYNFKGVIPAVLSMFDEAEELDEQGTRALTRFLVKRKVQGLYLCGSTGEGPMMTMKERMRETEIILEEVDGRLPVVVHVGAVSTKLSIELARHAQAYGAVGISSVPPYYYKFSGQQILGYYEELAASVDIPLIIYNIALAGLLNFGMIKKLAEIPNIAGIKFTDTDHSEIVRMKEEIGKEFLVYSGCDEMAVSGLIAGADGVIGSFYNCIPDLFLGVADAVARNDLTDAREKMRQAVCVVHYCCGAPCYFTAIREMMHIMGLPKSRSRSPWKPFSEEQRKEFLMGLKQLVRSKGIRAEFAEYL